MVTPSEVIAGRPAASSSVLACRRCPSALSRYCSNEGGIWVDHDEAVGSVDEDHGAVRDVEHVMTGADHCRVCRGRGRGWRRGRTGCRLR